jgi:hypothetical protein
VTNSHKLTLSVVVAARASGDALERCLAALETQRDGAEVLVCESHPSPATLRRRFDWAQFMQSPGQLVPGLWREGIDRSSGDIVALTISPMVPADDWIATILDEHRRHDVVAGAIEPAGGMRPSDWAEYFCRYASEVPPFEAHACANPPGDNVSYKRNLLDRVRHLYRDGFWETSIHQSLSAEGVRLWHTPQLIVRHRRSAGPVAFAFQRLHHGRAHGQWRARGSSAVRNLGGVLAAPLVPPLLTARIVRRVFAARRLRLRALASLPLIFLFYVPWAVGEARGQLDVLRGR